MEIILEIIVCRHRQQAEINLQVVGPRHDDNQPPLPVHRQRLQRQVGTVARTKGQARRPRAVRVAEGQGHVGRVKDEGILQGQTSVHVDEHEEW